jgi:pilus assembly protein Flp/PilA
LQLVNYILSSIFSRVNSDEEGQTLVEYGLIVALISIVSIAALTLVGTSVRDIFQLVAGVLDSAVS